MEYRRLGKAGVKVSTLCLGAMTFGEPSKGSFMHGVASDVETSMSVMNRALEAGINFIDTADVYGNDGLSERVIGQWFDKEGHRDDVVLATKFRFNMGQGPNGAGASRYRIMRTVEESLRRLKTDRIDLYQIHMQDLDTPEEEILRALDDLVRQGKVLYIGASNYAAYRLMESLGLSESQGLESFVTLQTQYNLIERGIEREHIPLCAKKGIGILPWSPLASGVLTGKYRKGEAPPEGTRLAKWEDRFKGIDTPRTWSIIDALRAASKELDASPSQIALAWLLKKPQVCSVIFGARTLSQLDDNIKAAALTLPEETMAALDDASSFDLGSLYNFISQVHGGRW